MRKEKKKECLMSQNFAKISWHIEGVAAFAPPSFRVVFQRQTQSRLNWHVHRRTRRATAALRSTSRR